MNGYSTRRHLSRRARAHEPAPLPADRLVAAVSAVFLAALLVCELLWGGLP